MLLPLMEVSNYPADKCDDSDIRGTEALGCLYACVRWCVRWRGADNDAIHADECYAKVQKSTKKLLTILY